MSGYVSSAISTAWGRRFVYLAVIKKHPGTPWAARAEWELKRDFGFSGAALVASAGSAGAEANQTEGAPLALAQSATVRNGRCEVRQSA